MTSDDRAKTRVVIYGSCVSRDTFEFLDQDVFQLDRYIARQSLISAYAQPTQLDESDIKSLTSEFQKRTIRDDFRGSLDGDLQTFGADADLLLWDLTDERFGVWDLGDGRIITRSVELVAAGLDQKFSESATHIPYGSRAHMKMWQEALDHFQQSISRANRNMQLILLAPSWSERDDTGATTGTATEVTVRKANQILRRYARKTRLPNHITLTRSQVEANSGHRWGRAPYHYTDSVYKTLSHKITALLT